MSKPKEEPTAPAQADPTPVDKPADEVALLKKRVAELEAENGQLKELLGRDQLDPGLRKLMKEKMAAGLPRETALECAIAQIEHDRKQETNKPTKS